MAVRAQNWQRSPTFSLTIFHVVVMGVVGGFLLAAAILLHGEHSLDTRWKSTWLLMTALGSLVAAEVFVFRPAIRKIREQVVQLRRTEDALVQSQETFQAALINAPIGMALVSLDGRFRMVNRSLSQITGYTEQEILATDFQSITHPDDLEADLALANRVLSGEINRYQMEKRYLHKAGHEVWILLSVCIVKDPIEQPLFFIAQIEDITERRRQQDELAAQSARLRAIFDHAVDAIITIDEQGTIESFNPAAVALFGYSQAEAVGKYVDVIMPAPFRNEHDVYLANYLQTHFGKEPGVSREIVGVRKDGTKFPLELTIGEFDLTGGRHFTGIIRDITARKRAEAAIEDAQLRLVRANRELCQLTVLDSLTGIPNRRAFDERLEEEWSRALRAGGYLSLIMIDVDHFKAYNDSLGHVEGDDCLRAVAHELHRCVRRLPDFVARYGGEEFVALLPGADAAGAFALADWMRERVQALNLPHPASSAGCRVTISLGVATFLVDRYLDSASLVRAADHALYQSKEHGRNCIHAADSHIDAPPDHADQVSN